MKLFLTVVALSLFERPLLRYLRPQSPIMTRKQRPRPSGSSDRPLPILTDMVADRNKVTQQEHKVPQTGPTQFQMQVARPQAQLREVVQHIQPPQSRSDSDGITQIYAGEVPGRQCRRLPVQRTSEDAQTLHTARESDTSATKPDIQRVQQAQLEQATVNSVDSGSSESNPRANAPAGSTVAALTDYIRAAENQLHPEKQRTSNVGKALIDPQIQSNKLYADREAWRAGQLEEVRSFKQERAYSGDMDIPPSPSDFDLMPFLHTEKGQRWTELYGADQAGGPELAPRTCEACCLRQLPCTSTQDLIACISCAIGNQICTYPGAPPPPREVPQTCFASPSGKKTTTHIVPAAHGHAFEVRAGSRFRIVDLHGEQVVDFMAWCLPYTPSTEHLSMSYTRHAIGGSAPPQVGECLYTNRDEPMFKLVVDTVKTHDMLYMACNPGFYKRLGQEGHRSCATNVAEAMAGWGMQSWLEVVDPFNVFQNTPYYALKALGCSRASDYIELEALKDVVCAVSSCPFDADGFNGGKVTEVAVVTEL